jgi:hypothetical protein
VSAEMSAQCQRTAVKPGRTTSNTASGFRLTMRFRRVPSRGVRPPKRLLTGGLLVRVQPGELWKSPAYTGLFDFGSEQGWMLWGRSWAHRPRPHAETSGPCSCIDAAPAESLHPLSRRSRTTLSLQAGLRRMVARAEGNTPVKPLRCYTGKHQWRTRGRSDSLTYFCERCGKTLDKPPKPGSGGAQAPLPPGGGAGPY